MRQLLQVAWTALWLIPGASAQCSMCRTAAAQANGIDKAILILFVPAVLLFSGVFLFAFHSQGGQEDPRNGSTPRDS
jgi:hypothetical protein